MVGWQKAKGSFQTPPLRDGSNPTALISQPKEKRDLFARVLLRNAAISTDIPAESPGPRLEANLPFPRVTKDEVQTSIFSARSTTPGSDGITTAVLKTAWPVIEDIVFRLYSGCVCEGWHPTCFKEAILVILPKPGKRDRALPRSYRPIALLSVLGKGLERLVARRLAWITVKFQVLHDQQFGALPLRSCSDLIAAAIHDIECAWQRGRVTSMLTLDIKGAFDAVLPGRLIRRLRCQGWPENLVRWVSSFVLGRRARIRLDGEMGDVFDLECGLPQGSPVSPILFMLHIEPLFKLGTVHPGRKRSRFGYADDIAIMASSTSLEDNCALLAKEWEEAQEWGALEGITFDTDKSELIHFTKRPKDRNPPITVRLLDGRQHTVQAVNQGASLRWLGVHFDRRLTFKNHVKGHCAKACQVVNGLRGLGNTAWGAPTHLLRRAITSCVLPIQYYASEAWWPGRNRIKNGHIASNGVNGLLNQLDITQAKAIRAALPVYRTTPVSILQREAALPPAEVMLDAKLHKASVRIHRLDDRHPLRTRLGERPGPDSRLRRMASLIERHAEYIDPLELPPWERSADWHTALSMVGYEPRKTKDELATAFTDRLGALSKRDIVVYTDGSQMVDGSRTAAGAGWVGYQATRQIFRGSEPLGHQTEVFDAEAQAAFRGLLEAMRSPTARMADNVHICLDNLAVTARLVTRSPGSSQARFRAFSELSVSWAQRGRTSWTRPGRVYIWWCPGHTGIAGNEEADALAKEACRQIPESQPQPTLAHLKRESRAADLQAFARRWPSICPRQYADLGISPHPKPPELRLPRHLLGRLYAARSHHGDFAAYHERFAHQDALLHCSCGRRKTPVHFYFCKRGRKATPRHLRRRMAKASIDFLLGTTQGASLLCEWMEATNFFSEICPSH
ncbi:reverse transcriptase [Colletotrichum higginsianum]|uniref:Reverse transcriptase n=1 Tax=Colletotrichum higginsianum (strain IMI 349063) TaxID=759273 RepID=H1V6E3_COLHI|nr:reverse transcriptase [Colletotrichum higginsianum]